MRTNFRMEAEYITMVRGNTLSFNIILPNLDTLDTAYLTIKKDLESDEALVQKSLGIGIYQLEEGLYVVRIAPEDTYNLDVGKYYYDLQVGVNGEVFTVKTGILELIYDVTREG